MLLETQRNDNKIMLQIGHWTKPQNILTGAL